MFAQNHNDVFRNQCKLERKRGVMSAHQAVAWGVIIVFGQNSMQVYLILSILNYELRVKKIHGFPGCPPKGGFLPECILMYELLPFSVSKNVEATFHEF